MSTPNRKPASKTSTSSTRTPTSSTRTQSPSSSRTTSRQNSTSTSTTSRNVSRTPSSTNRPASPAAKRTSTSNKPSAKDDKKKKEDEEKKKQEEEEKKKAAEEEERKKREEEEERKKKEEEDPDAEEKANLRRTIEARKAELARIQKDMHALTLYHKHETATERAEKFREKAAEHRADHARMKKQVDLLRNADRVAVHLRDMKDQQQKHVRMKNAHIRQKQATISIIRKRRAEQQEDRRRLVKEVAEEIDEILAVAERFDDSSRLTETLVPSRSMAAVVAFDAQEDEALASLIQLNRFLVLRDGDETQTLSDLRVTLQAEAEAAIHEKTDEAYEYEQNWLRQRERMLLELSRVRVLADETAFHLRRGTNIKGSTQYGLDTTSSEAGRVRELTMTHAELQAKVNDAKHENNHVQYDWDKHEQALSAESDEAQLRLMETTKLKKEMKQANREWRQRYAELQGAYTGNAVAVLDFEDSDDDDNNENNNEVSPARTTTSNKSGLQSNTPRKKFTPDMLDRLMTPTKAHKKHQETAEMERNQHGKTMFEMQSKRPKGASKA